MLRNIFAGTRVDPVMRLVREMNLDVGLHRSGKNTCWTIKDNLCYNPELCHWLEKYIIQQKVVF